MNTGKGIATIKERSLLAEIEIQERALQLYEKVILENVGQVLSLAKMNLFLADQITPVYAQQKIDRSRKLIGKAIHDLRQITQQLSVKELHRKGLEFSIEQELQHNLQSKSCTVAFGIHGSSFKLEKERETILFNALQQLLRQITLLPLTKVEINIFYLQYKMLVKIKCHPKNSTTLENLEAASFNKAMENLSSIDATLKMNARGANLYFSIVAKK